MYLVLINMGCPKEFYQRRDGGCVITRCFIPRSHELTNFLFSESMMYRVLMLIWGVPKSSLSKEGWGQRFSHSQRKSKRYGKCSNILNLFLVLFSIKCWLLLNGFICL